MSGGIIALVCILSIFGVIALVALFYWFCLRRQNTTKEDSSVDNFQSINKQLEQSLVKSEPKTYGEISTPTPMVEPRNLYQQSQIPNNSAQEEKPKRENYDMQKGFGLSTTGAAAFPSVTSQITSTFDLSDSE